MIFEIIKKIDGFNRFCELLVFCYFLVVFSINRLTYLSVFNVCFVNIFDELLRQPKNHKNEFYSYFLTA